MDDQYDHFEIEFPICKSFDNVEHKEKLFDKTLNLVI